MENVANTKMKLTSNPCNNGSSGSHDDLFELMRLKSVDDDYSDILEDIFISLTKSWHLAIFIAFVCAVISFNGIANHSNDMNINRNSKIPLVRNIPSSKELENFRIKSKFIKSRFYLDSGINELFTLNFKNYSSLNANIPTFFMNGVMFVIPYSNYFESIEKVIDIHFILRNDS